MRYTRRRGATSRHGGSCSSSTSTRCTGSASRSRTAGMAEELAQQVFIIAARRVHRFDPSRATFRAWLFGIAKNRYMTMQASEQRRKRHEESSAKESSEAVTRGEPDLQVHEALARLPSNYRIVLDAKYLRGLSMKEIAADNGASIEAIESLLRRARANFARVYEQMRTLE
ncbi:MAG TPA: hypothetical protein DIU00_12390 [Phycisphaerales bacterium]|nr:hypothetical protein [Phycisphaerales bacterium]